MQRGLSRGHAAGFEQRACSGVFAEGMQQGLSRGHAGCKQAHEQRVTKEPENAHNNREVGCDRKEEGPGSTAPAADAANAGVVGLVAGSTASAAAAMNASLAQLMGESAGAQGRIAFLRGSSSKR